MRPAFDPAVAALHINHKAVARRIPQSTGYVRQPARVGTSSIAAVPPRDRADRRLVASRIGPVVGPLYAEYQLAGLIIEPDHTASESSSRVHRRKFKSNREGDGGIL